MLNDDQANQIQNILFNDEELNTYAVIDGAACPELRFKLYEWQPISSCLWSGDLEPDLEEVAPYMVKLEKNADITRWLIKEGWQKHWNIFIATRLQPKEFRKQIRKLQLVRSPEGQTLFFRFYDPRVMEIFLPTCNEEQLEEVFTDIKRIFYSNRENLMLSIVQHDMSQGGIDIRTQSFNGIGNIS